MDLNGRVAVITGAASGIGRAAALRFAREGVAGLVVADVNAEGLKPVAEATGGLAVTCDVSREGDLQRLVSRAEERYGRVDVFFSNAGVIGLGGVEAPDEVWERHWKVHVMSHVWAARAVVEKMLARGGGYFLLTASAAGLLNIVESAPYGVTKHGTVGLAEWLAITYGRRGLRVSCLCPQAVITGMFQGDGGSAGADGVLTAEQVADDVVKGMAEERFLILPHPRVLEYLRNKAASYDRWIGGMQKIFLSQQKSEP
jgi:NAD(P)-dependent dehydrogenase (short-subunit alcohol dehydrogenase family)